MATFTKIALTGSVQSSKSGKGLLVTGTTTGASVISHTTGTSAVIFDEIWLYASNNSASAVNLTLEWDGTSNNTVLSIVANKTVLVVPGWMLSGDGAGTASTVKAYAGTGSVINLFGFVNRIA